MSRFGRRGPGDDAADPDQTDVELDGDEDDVDEITDEELDADLQEAFDDPTLHVEEDAPYADADDRLSMDEAAQTLLRTRKEKATRQSRPGKVAKEHHGPLARLYRGETRFDFVGHRRIWFVLSTIVILVGIVSIVLRGGLNLGIEFKGGVEWTVPIHNVTQVQATNAMQAAGLPSPVVQILGHGTSDHLNVQADLNKLSSTALAAEEQKVSEALARLSHTTVASVNNNRQTVGPSWGSSVTNKAIEALIVFFVAVGIYISIRFEPKMALAAFIAMVHDVLVAVGIYSIFNFQVTPDTVVAILTILGYSLYDTVVVFDRVRDNTKGIGSTGRMSYFQMINLSMNQTLARSINTSLVAILPVLSVLLVGAQFLGAITLQNYGLALFVGLLSGAYSSIFIASPILALLKRNESRWVAIEQRLIQRGGLTEGLSALDAATMSTQIAISAGGQQRAAAPAKRAGPIRPGSGAAANRGTAVMDRPAGGGPDGQGVGGPAGAGAPRPRKGKGKRRR